MARHRNTGKVAQWSQAATELDDGSGLLEGAGKQFRSIKLRTPADAKRAEVKRLIRKAFVLGGTTTMRNDKRK